jgi:hypothetical protein
MDKQQLTEIAVTALKGAAFAGLIRVAQTLTKDVKVGNQKLVMFTAKK